MVNSIADLQQDKPRKRVASDYLALAVATCGVGYMPIAPGTWGSAVGVGLFLLLQFAAARLFAITRLDRMERLTQSSFFLAVELVAITLVTLAGIWAASRAEQLLDRKDPGKVVIDEVAGQLIALLPIGLRLNAFPAMIIAFLLFRLFDIVKPYPARRFEHLESGLGIMSDDVVAGAYAAVGLSIIIAVELLILS